MLLRETYAKEWHVRTRIIQKTESGGKDPPPKEKTNRLNKKIQQFFFLFSLAAEKKKARIDYGIKQGQVVDDIMFMFTLRH